MFQYAVFLFPFFLVFKVNIRLYEQLLSVNAGKSRAEKLFTGTCFTQWCYSVLENSWSILSEFLSDMGAIVQYIKTEVWLRRIRSK